MDYAHIRKYVIPGIIACLLLVFAVYFIATNSPKSGESIQLSVTPPQNEANALTGTQTATGTTGSGTHASSGTTVVHDGLDGIRAIPNTDVFVSLLERTGVASGISTAGTYTFFVPTDAAFAAMPGAPVTSLSFDAQKRLAEYLIVANQMISVDSVKYGHVATMSGDLLNNNVFQTTSVSGNSPVLDTYRVGNGIVYVTDIVLLPPERRPFPF
jgi:uncharacterized surface protein with fasciclin (FAS1) repeats